jgi:hypothetical protein
MREGRLTKWSDRKAEFRPTAGNWGGDNQCIAENGEYKTTCSNSLATMDSVGKRERERERERDRERELVYLQRLASTQPRVVICWPPSTTLVYVSVLHSRSLYM